MVVVGVWGFSRCYGHTDKMLGEKGCVCWSVRPHKSESTAGPIGTSWYVGCHVALCTCSGSCRHKSGVCALLCALLAAHGTGRNVCTSRRSLLWDRFVVQESLVTAMGWPVLSPEGRMLACRLGCKLADALHLCCLCHKERPVWLLHLTGLCHTTMLATL